MSFKRITGRCLALEALDVSGRKALAPDLLALIEEVNLTSDGTKGYGVVQLRQGSALRRVIRPAILTR